MSQDLIFAPMGALAFFTFAVLAMIPLRRFSAGRAGRVRADDFKLGESAAVPPDVSIANRAYMNLLEVPSLFYAVCLMFYVSSRVSPQVLEVAWTYVALRIAHSLIHLTYNKVMHRLIPFAISNFVLIALWVMFFVS